MPRMLSTTKKILYIVIVACIFIQISVISQSTIIGSFQGGKVLNFFGYYLFVTRNVTAEWLARRELEEDASTSALLADNVTTKVFLFAHMRGGSSVMGELFNTDPKAVMWYEPGDAFFNHYYGLAHENLPQNDLFLTNGSRRTLEAHELADMTDYYSNMLSCQLESLPPQAMGHYFLSESTAMNGFMGCLQKHKRKVQINTCAKAISGICHTRLVTESRRNQCHVFLNYTRHFMRQPNVTRSKKEIVELVFNATKLMPNVTQTVRSNIGMFVNQELCLQQMTRDTNRCIGVAYKRCNASRLHVVQVNRMKMEDLEELILKHPEMKVIHYLRDPRAIALSRTKTTNRGQSVIEASKFLCPRMAEDMRVRHILEKRYPGAFLEIRYENLASSPIKVANQVYSSWGGTSPPQWTQFVQKNMYSKAKGGAYGFGITVANATQNAQKWRKGITNDTLQTINSYCGDTLRTLGYEL